MERERISIPMVIGGKEVETKETTQAVMPHRKEHVLADVAKGGPEHVQQAIDAAREAHADWSRLPVGGARLGLPPRRRAARRPVALDARRRDDAQPVEDRPPGRDRRRLRS